MATTLLERPPRKIDPLADAIADAEGWPERRPWRGRRFDRARQGDKGPPRRTGIVTATCRSSTIWRAFQPSGATAT
jgi:hypothetical protein